MSATKKRVTWNGIPLTVASVEECAQSEYMLCTRADFPSPFKDNKYGSCAICGHRIQYRPYMPEGPVKVCIDCFPNVMRPQA